MVQAQIICISDSQNIYRTRNGLVLDEVRDISFYKKADLAYITNAEYDDGTQVEVFVLTSEKTIPGCLIDVRILGGLKIIENNVYKHILLGVPKVDPKYDNVNNLKDVGQYTLNDIKKFISTYRKNIKIIGWKDKVDAEKALKKAKTLFKRRQNV